MAGTINLKKYKRIIDKIRELGFYDFYQAGSISQFHELNLVFEDKKRKIKYWIGKSFGKFFIAYEIGYTEDRRNFKQINCHKGTQKEVCEKFTEVVAMLNEKYEIA